MVQPIHANARPSLHQVQQTQLHGNAPSARGSHVQDQYPKGDGSFANRVRGTQPKPELDLHLSMMANDVYATDNLKGAGRTETRSEADLAAAGWRRLQADGDHLVDAQGNRIPISPKLLNPADTGFDAAIYQNDQGQYVVAFRGTDDDWRLHDDNGQFMGPGTDVRANLGQGSGMSVEQYQQAMNLATIAVQTFGAGNVAFTGHSLGGGLASAAMLKTGAPGATFNAAGLSDNTLRDLGFASANEAREILANNGQIRRYNVEGEPLTAAQQMAGVGALPEAVGHELRVAPPPGCTDLHGGGGDDQSYVESLRQQQPIYRPGGAPAPLRSAEDTLESGLKGLISLGANAYQAGYGVGQALGQTQREMAGILRHDMAQGHVVQAGVKLAGSAADGALDMGASVVKESADAAGDLLMESGTLAGNLLRNEARGTWLEAPANWLAKGVETLGYGANKLVDGVGALAATGMDKLGDGLQWGSEKIAAGIQAGKEMLADGAVWVGNKVSEGAQWAGNKLAEGADWVGDKVSGVGRWLNQNLNPFGR
ncbi:hypothetical protein EII20_09715 [Comamonadaceae bacterium OH2545_COT-014]|nr:hypothetical protein EII20_09715 [Comamonadaceae bacterium OH2545_COT-014]